MLAEYDQHSRIIGGEPEPMMDAAAAAYVALTASGTDTLLMAADHALRRELNRRIPDDLITARAAWAAAGGHCGKERCSRWPPTQGCILVLDNVTDPPDDRNASVRWAR